MRIPVRWCGLPTLCAALVPSPERLAFLLVLLGLVAGTRPASAAAAQAGGELSAKQIRAGWVRLFDGSTTSGWVPRGTVQWRVEDGALTPIPGTGGGFLCTTNEYADFELHAEFWIDAVANSGVFLRCPAQGEIVLGKAYEVNIYDAHEKWPTGSINEVKRGSGNPKSVGRWNRFDIRAEGSHFVVRLNGRTVLDATDDKVARGVIGLQTLTGNGVVKFRSVRIRPLGAGGASAGMSAGSDSVPARH